MKYLRYILLLIALILVTFIFFKSNNEVAEKIPIITFHRLVPDKLKKEKYADNQWVGSIDVFENMMKYISDNGYTTISNKEFYDWYKGKIELPKKTVMITIDDGFYEDYYLAYPIIKKYNLKATSFVVGERIKDTTPKYKENETHYLGLDVINKIRLEYPNFEIQSHSYNMHYYEQDGSHRIKNMTYDEILQDTKMMKKYNFQTFAYPFGDFTDDAKKVLKNEGYLCAYRFAHSDYARRSNDQYEIYRIKINGEANLDKLKKWLNN